jgi:hypothetical protein
MSIKVEPEILQAEKLNLKKHNGQRSHVLSLIHISIDGLEQRRVERGHLHLKLDLRQKKEKELVLEISLVRKLLGRDL